MKRFSGSTIIVATVFSTIIHFFVLTLLDTIPLVPKEVSPRAELFMVDLITLKTARAVPQEEEVTVEKKVEEVKKQEVKKKEATKQAAKKEAIKKEEKKEQVVLADKRKTAKEDTKKHEVDTEQQQLAAAIRGIKQKVAARGKGNSPRTEVTEAIKKEYDTKAAEMVAGFWAILNIWSEEQLEAKIVIEVDADGQVTPRFEQSSGNQAFDQAALRAINRAAPFGPPPGNEPREIPLRFTSQLR